jgi:hypothetical protein
VEITDGIEKNGNINEEDLTETDKEKYIAYHELDSKKVIKWSEISKISWLVDSQNIKINQSVLDRSNNQLRTNSLGLLEMEASAAFLRKIDMPDIESEDYQVLPDKKLYNDNTNKFNVLKAIDISGALGYRIFFSKPQEFLFVGDWTKIEDNIKAELLKYGIWFRSNEDFKNELDKNTIFHHQFVLYDDTSINDELLRNVFSDRMDDLKTIALKNALPIRLLKIDNKSKIIQCLKSNDGFDINALEIIIWKLWVAKICPNKEISVQISVPDRNDKFNIVLFDHLKDPITNANDRQQWDKAVKKKDEGMDFILIMEALSTNAQNKLPEFIRIATAKTRSGIDLSLSNIESTLISSDNLYIKCKIAESYIYKVLVIDERIQVFSTQIYIDGLTHFEIFSHSNVVMPDYNTPIKLDKLDFKDNDIHLIEDFISTNIIDSKFLVIHYGILERMYKKITIDEKLIEWSKIARVIVTSGRGKQSLNLPPQVCYVNLSPISNVFIENRNKYSINYLLNQTRR